jgi:hypothetical protein
VSTPPETSVDPEDSVKFLKSLTTLLVCWGTPCSPRRVLSMNLLSSLFDSLDELSFDEEAGAGGAAGGRIDYTRFFTSL